MVAHPDDAEWGCSGTVAKWCKDGMEVVYVICTDGSKGTDDPNVLPQQLTEMRKKEQRNACKVLGVKEVVFLDYEDAMLEPTLELRKDIVRQIRKHKPDVLIAPQPVRYLEGSGYIGHPGPYCRGRSHPFGCLSRRPGPLHLPRAWIEEEGAGAPQGEGVADTQPDTGGGQVDRRNRLTEHGNKRPEAAREPGRSRGCREKHASLARRDGPVKWCRVRRSLQVLPVPVADKTVHHMEVMGVHRGCRNPAGSLTEVVRDCRSN